MASPAINLAAVGDLALGGEFLARAKPAGASLNYPFLPLAETFSQVDLLVVNLEGPLCNDGPPRPGRTALLYNDPEVLDWLASFPNCVCCLANNHSMDYGAEALARTRDLLSSRGIQFVGAGLSSTEADTPLRIRVGGLTVSILAFTTDEPHVGSLIASSTSPGCCGMPSPEVALSRIAFSAAESDVVIVLLHMGFEYFTYPTPEQVSLNRSFVAAGATLVIAHHPHVQQGVEAIAKSLICHSLGNLLLPELPSTTGRVQYRKPSTKQFAILRAEVGRNAVKTWRLIGGRCDRDYHLLPYTGDAAVRFENQMASLAIPFAENEYRRFWTKYSERRKRELGREAIRDAVSKLFLSNPRTLLQTLSFRDVTRNIRRVLGRS